MKIVRTFELNDPARGTAPLFLTLSIDVGSSWQAQSAATDRLRDVAQKIQDVLKSGNR